MPKRLSIVASSESTRQSDGQRGRRSERNRGRPPESLNKPTLARRAQKEIQETITQASNQVSDSTRRRRSRLSAVLRAGNTTGVRSSGRRMQPSIRRTRSQWELAESDEDSSCIIVKQYIEAMFPDPRCLFASTFRDSESWELIPWEGLPMVG